MHKYSWSDGRETLPIYGKESSLNQKAMTLGLFMYHWDVGPTKFSTNGDPRLNLTYFMARSNLNSNAFNWEIILVRCV